MPGAVQPGNGSDAELYSLSDYSVRLAADVALSEYATWKGSTPDAYFTGIEKADRYVKAVGAYIDSHMKWEKDEGDWDGAQKAARTISESHTRCPEDYCGDCEDHSIMRAALLRSLGFRHDCIFSADTITKTLTRVRTSALVRRRRIQTVTPTTSSTPKVNIGSSTTAV